MVRRPWFPFGSLGSPDDGESEAERETRKEAERELDAELEARESNEATVSVDDC